MVAAGGRMFRIDKVQCPPFSMPLLYLGREGGVWQSAAQIFVGGAAAPCTPIVTGLAMNLDGFDKGLVMSVEEERSIGGC